MKTEIFTLYFLERLLINTTSIIILVRFVYYPIYQKKDFNFTFFLLNFIVFLLTFLLEKTGAFGSFGTAIGLLAAFTLLRIRTETLSIKDMTYLFIVMALGLINSTMKSPYYEIATLNAMIIGAAFAVDSNLLMPTHHTKTIEFNNLENIQPEKHNLLIADLRQKTGLNIRRINIEHIDFGKNRVVIKIYY